MLFLEMRLHFSTALKKFTNYRFLLMFMRSLLMKFNENYIVIRSNLSKTDFTRQISTFMKIVNFKNKLQIVNTVFTVGNWEMRRLNQINWDVLLQRFREFGVLMFRIIFLFWLEILSKRLWFLMQNDYRSSVNNKKS